MYEFDHGEDVLPSADQYIVGFLLWFSTEDGYLHLTCGSQGPTLDPLMHSPRGASEFCVSQSKVKPGNQVHMWK